MAKDKVAAIYSSGLTIYDDLGQRPELFLATAELARILNEELHGLSLDYPIRTRSKVIKQEICSALGYPTPTSFRKSQPRFPGQNFDAYVQKSDNLQIWNEQLGANRRYVLIRVDEVDKVTKVRVVTGAQLAKLDTTGTLTQKLQAKSRAPVDQSHLVSRADTPNAIARLLGSPPTPWSGFKPIADVYQALHALIGTRLVDPGSDQERGRGAALHQAICRCLGLVDCHDDGQFPDIQPQLLEIKMQTAPTVDLGLVSPDSTEHLPDHLELRPCDARYAVFYGTIVQAEVRLDHLVLTTGKDFFKFFRRFEGNVRNTKNQISLPHDFFDSSP